MALLAKRLLTHNARRALKAKRKAAPPNPLRVDPTRTASLRRAFVADLRRRFAKLRLAVVDAVEREDVFGLRMANGRPAFAANVYCPTGPGGGKDPTCSPGGGVATAGTVKVHHFTVGGDSVGKEFGEGEVTAVYTDLLEFPGGLLEDVAPLKDNSRKPIIVVDTGERYRIVDGVGRASGMRNAGREEVHAIIVTEGDLRERSARGDDEEWNELIYQEYVPHLTYFATTNASALTANTRWAFLSRPAQLRAFTAWLRQQARAGILGPGADGPSVTANDLYQRYVEAGFRKGAGRAFEDTRRTRRGRDTLGTTGQQDVWPFGGARGRDDFIRLAFNQPVAVEKVELLASRVYTELEGVTDAMAQQMTRTLADGLVQGKAPRDIARDLAANVDGIGFKRAELIAQTELIRSHSEGQLTALEMLGVEEVGVMVEWVVTPDAKVCPACKAMAGVVLKIAEARGMIPRHPRCRCSWIPAGLGESSKDQLRTKAAIDRAVRTSARRGGNDGFRPGKAIAKKRPEPIVTGNVFCPTGPGGGKDNSCGKGGALPERSSDREAFYKTLPVAPVQTHRGPIKPIGDDRWLHEQGVVWTTEKVRQLNYGLDPRSPSFAEGLRKVEAAARAEMATLPSSFAELRGVMTRSRIDDLAKRLGGVPDFTRAKKDGTDILFWGLPGGHAMWTDWAGERRGVMHRDKVPGTTRNAAIPPPANLALAGADLLAFSRWMAAMEGKQ